MPLGVSVVITAYNSSETISGTLSSIGGLDGREAPARTIVFDNASTDGTVDLCRRFGWVRTVRSERNLGLARANNAAASLCPPGPILFLNPDVRVLPGSLEALAEFCDSHPSTGVAGPCMLGLDGTPQSTARRFPDLMTIAARRTALGSTESGRRRVSEHMPRPDPLGAPRTADWLVGAALWVTAAGRRRFGLMSPGYFLYFEDVELCWRAWSSGMEVWLVPASRMEHVPRRQSARSAAALLLHLRSMCRFYRDHPRAISGGRP